VIVYPSIQELVVRSSKLQPIPRMTSALRDASFAAYVPFRPMTPADSRQLSSTDVLPLGLVTTGTWTNSANRRSSSLASLMRTPCPAMMTGRSAARSASTTAASTSGSPGARWLTRLGGPARSTSASSTQTLNGTSMSTGPGVPLGMMSTACRTASGTISGLVGWKLRFTYGRITDGKSAWKYFPDAWNGPRLNWLVGTFPVIARNADESIMAPA